jgi:hypothetical protein
VVAEEDPLHDHAAAADRDAHANSAMETTPVNEVPIAAPTTNPHVHIGAATAPVAAHTFPAATLAATDSGTSRASAACRGRSTAATAARACCRTATAASAGRRTAAARATTGLGGSASAATGPSCTTSATAGPSTAGSASTTAAGLCDLQRFRCASVIR